MQSPSGGHSITQFEEAAFGRQRLSMNQTDHQNAVLAIKNEFFNQNLGSCSGCGGSGAANCTHHQRVFMRQNEEAKRDTEGQMVPINMSACIMDLKGIHLGANVILNINFNSFRRLTKPRGKTRDSCTPQTTQAAAPQKQGGSSKHRRLGRNSISSNTRDSFRR